MRRRLLYGTVLTAVVATSLCFAAPEPAIVQRDGQWTLQVRYEPPMQIVLPGGPTGEIRYWYLIVSVTNRTGHDAEFYPKCDLMTDTFQIVPSGLAVPPAVFAAIKQRHQSRYPFLEPFQGVANRILEGEDNAKDLAIIWPDFDAQAQAFKIFLSGLSNETAVVPHPVAVDKTTNQPVPVYLRKTLQLTYALRGDPALRSAVEVVFKGQGWVMR